MSKLNLREKSNIKMEKIPINKFFKVEENWEKEWQGMPEFNQKDLTAFKSITVHFANKEDMEEFARLVGQKITIKRKSLWYPEADKIQDSRRRYVDES